MKRRGFTRWYQALLLVVGAAWNALLCAKLGGARGPSVVGFLFEMVPVFVLVASARIVRSAAVLLVLAIAHFALLATAASSVIGATSSTAAVALALATLVSTVVISIIAAASALCCWRHHSRSRSEEPATKPY